MELGSEATLARIRECLQQAEISVREIEHAPTETSEASAEVRGEPLYVGAKALLLKTDDVFRLFCVARRRETRLCIRKERIGFKETAICNSRRAFRVDRPRTRQRTSLWHARIAF